MRTAVRAVMQAILVAPDAEMRRAIVTKKKKITIRAGGRAYHMGPAMLCCHVDPWAVLVDITSVRICPLGELTAEETQSEGAGSLSETLTLLRRYYPKMQMHDLVTVVRWDNARGDLVPVESE